MSVPPSSTPGPENDPTQPPSDHQPDGQGTQPPPGGAGAQQPASSHSAQDDQLLSAGAHVGGLLTSFIVPAILWAIYRDRSPVIEEHARKALNFQLILLPVYIFASILAFILPLGFVGSLLQFAVFVFSAIFAIQGAIAAYNSRQFSYPINVEIVKKQ